MGQQVPPMSCQPSTFCTRERLTADSGSDAVTMTLSPENSEKPVKASALPVFALARAVCAC